MKCTNCNQREKEKGSGFAWCDICRLEYLCESNIKSIATAVDSIAYLKTKIKEIEQNYNFHKIDNLYLELIYKIKL